MMALGPVGFAAPWMLAALVALPVLWVILRAVPPAMREVIFPGAVLLEGLPDPPPLRQRTPWWLVLLRTLALAAVILALAGPVWKPADSGDGRGPLLIVLDAGWAAAPGWARAQARAAAALQGAAAAGRPAALLLADGQPPAPVFADASVALAALRAAQPQPWETRYPPAAAGALDGAPASFDTLWLADGLDHPGRTALLTALTARGTVSVVPPASTISALVEEADEAGQPALMLHWTGGGPAPTVLAQGPDPQGIPRDLARLVAASPRSAAGITSARVALDLPAELRNRVTRFAIEGAQGAGAVVLADDGVRRRKVALIGNARATEGQALLSPLHYLRRALAPTADLIEGSLAEVLPASPDVIVLADQPLSTPQPDLAEWVDKGGVLIRFAGPRMAAAPGLAGDPLLPVRLRPGGRDAGGALSWDTPRPLAPFAPGGPFAGLTPDPEVTVRAQLLPEPDPDLPQRTLASLSDGTPLVTRAPLGKGQLLLIHTTADPEWSDWPLSGLFVAMLERLVLTAGRGARGADPSADAARADHWTAVVTLDGFGRDGDPGALAPLTAAAVAAGAAPGAPAGIYRAGERRKALNAGSPLTLAAWAGATLEKAGTRPGLPLVAPLLVAAMVALVMDAIASALLSGSGRRMGKRLS